MNDFGQVPDSAPAPASSGMKNPVNSPDLFIIADAPAIFDVAKACTAVANFNIAGLVPLSSLNDASPALTANSTVCIALTQPFADDIAKEALQRFGLELPSETPVQWIDGRSAEAVTSTPLMDVGGKTTSTIQGDPTEIPIWQKALVQLYQAHLSPKQVNKAPPDDGKRVYPLRRWDQYVCDLLLRRSPTAVKKVEKLEPDEARLQEFLILCRMYLQPSPSPNGRSTADPIAWLFLVYTAAQFVRQPVSGPRETSLPVPELPANFDQVPPLHLSPDTFCLVVLSIMIGLEEDIALARIQPTFSEDAVTVSFTGRLNLRRYFADAEGDAIDSAWDKFATSSQEFFKVQVESDPAEARITIHFTTRP